MRRLEAAEAQLAQLCSSETVKQLVAAKQELAEQEDQIDRLKIKCRGLEERLQRYEPAERVDVGDGRAS